MAPTIKDVARIAQVSITTVSKVINNHPSISDKTAKKVMEVIKELNYTPNLRARSFASKKTFRVAFVVQIKANQAFSNPHLFEIMVGCQQYLYNNNYQMEFIGLRKGEFEKEIKFLIDSKNIDGIIIHVSALTPVIAKYLTKTNFAHVVIGLPDFPTSVCWIDNNNELSGRLAAKHLYETGIKKMIYLGGSKRDHISEMRLNGVQNELEDHQLHVAERDIIHTDSTYEDAYDKLKTYMMHHQKPEAIICANNTIDMACVDLLNDLGLEMPGDVSVITFDDFPYATITKPPTTTINIDVFDLGRQAAQFLLNKIKKPNHWFQTYVTSPLLVMRKTTKKMD